ncbi:SpoIIE family protein phosphatase [Streptomyces sp. NPDC003697]
MSPLFPFDDAATARAVVDQHGVLTEWNEGARRLLGWTPEEVVGRPAADLLVARPRAPGPTARGARSWNGTLGLRHRDGHTVSAWVLAHRGRPDDGGGWLLVTPLRDGPPPGPDDPLSRAELMQSPCAVAVYDERLRLHGMNAAMAEVLGAPGERLRGLRLPEIGDRAESESLERRMRQVLTTGRADEMRTYVLMGAEGRVNAWLARISPVTDAAGRVRGVCVAAHDFTEQYRAQERLRLVNEASLRLGTTLDVTRTAQELADVCVPALADFVSVDLLDFAGQDVGPSAGPATAPVALRRAAHRSVHPGEPEAVVPLGQVRTYPATSPQAASLLTGQSIVVSRGPGDLEERVAEDPERSRQAERPGVHTTLSVPVRARGLTLGVAVLTRFERRPDPFTSEDVLLAEQITVRAALCLDNARRYSLERETALALQRSLLPRTLPRTAGVDAASRYLPAARAEVGGDWFDVIPLSGMRVAMVVGDVVGHGLQASATMGRLRTAVRTLADLDLAPDELLTHLDDLVAAMAAEAGSDGREVGATCLYAVYDPVSRHCSLARAGHPLPVAVPPDGPPRRLELPDGPALGLGGPPFESAELDLREGTLLAFYTDGLVASPDRDADESHRLLCDVLSDPSASLEEVCDRVLRALLPPGGAPDDVALLLTRTRGLPASQVATWDIPADPSLVASIRKQVLEQLDEWGLSDAAFVTELVVSELVTNAIRYGTPPIRLRLIHDESTLICEVSDSSHTAPHPRRAKMWDEGGRGLLLVAQLARRWGSRHTHEGKTIWAELSLRDEK